MITDPRNFIDTGTERGQISTGSQKPRIPQTLPAIDVTKPGLPSYQPRYTENWIRDEDSAVFLARLIQEFWVNKGFPTVRAWVEITRVAELHKNGKRPVFCIRSNLVNGLPPKRLADSPLAQSAALH